MRKVLIAVSVLVALGVVAQRGTKDAQTEDIKVVNPNNPTPGKNVVKGEIKMTDGISKPKPAASNNAAKPAVVADEAKMSGRDFGQQRADEVRESHGKPATDKEAKEMTKAIRESVKSQVKTIDGKINDANDLIEEKHDSGEMTDLEYELNMAKLDAFRARKNAIEDKVK